MRKLATIQRIKALEPIEGADQIEKATVLGWHLVVKKGDFQVGDLCVYCEPDSILPEKPEFEFLRPRGFRIKTIRLRGQVSQGIAFPLMIIPIEAYPINNGELKEDMDLTNVLGVTKYEKPIPACLSGMVKGGRPDFVPKTDETRVQVLQKVLTKYKGELCYVTEKLDGSSVSYYLKDGVFGACSRNLELVETENNSVWKVAREMKIEEKMRSFYEKYKLELVLQGEIVGEGIQGNKLKLRGQTVYFFNVFEITDYRYMDYSNVVWALQAMDLPMVPLITEYFELLDDIDQLVSSATIKSAINSEVWAEGVVIRPMQEQMDMLLSTQNFNNGRVTFKVINPEFLIKYNSE